MSKEILCPAKPCSTAKCRRPPAPLHGPPLVIRLGIGGVNPAWHASGIAGPVLPPGMSLTRLLSRHQIKTERHPVSHLHCAGRSSAERLDPEIRFAWQ